MASVIVGRMMVSVAAKMAVVLEHTMVFSIASVAAARTPLAVEVAMVFWCHFCCLSVLVPHLIEGKLVVEHSLVMAEPAAERDSIHLAHLLQPTLLLPVVVALVVVVLGKREGQLVFWVAVVAKMAVEVVVPLSLYLQSGHIALVVKD